MKMLMLQWLVMKWMWDADWKTAVKLIFVSDDGALDFV